MKKVPATPEEVVAEEFDRLRGRVLGLIESWGLPERQEEGAKQLYKALTYDTQKTVSELLKMVAQGKAWQIP